ncbi:acyl-CoA dehydrogenase family member 11-like [Porites lutea]|uniref:acyl-CoA dehydrogenase family member 11-like n=1 Tax=Porites lutea TaxID=51062 RepID=UPI003CC60838
MEEHAFDSSKLHGYLRENLADFPPEEGELKVFKFSAGTSNPTFLLRKNGKEFVLRHKSPVEMYVGYHKVDVEYKIMSALSGASVPVPKMYLFCEDKTVMGQEFYVMEYIKGRQFPDANLPGVPADQTRAIFEAAIRTLVQLQTVNTDGLHLEGLGDKENYFQARLEKLYEGYKRTERKAVPKAHQLMEWLKNNLPKENRKPVIYHADYRISNMIFKEDEPQILAVIDWEAACWGHPYEDLAYFCFPFHFPAELEVLPTGKVGYYSEGIPSEESLLSLYCQLSGETLPLPDWTFFLGLTFFRVIVNIQTVLAQLTDSPVPFPFPVESIANMLEPLADYACSFVGVK